MKILAKQLSPEVKSVKGWIVYVMDFERPIEAEICELNDLKYTINKYKTKYKI
jgi:hypothetical protein